MAFGSKKLPKKETTFTTFSPIYLDQKDGKRTIRVVGDSLVVYREYWLENVTYKQGDSIVKGKKPVIYGVLNDDGDLVGFEDENPYKNPYELWLKTQDEAIQKRLYGKWRFATNVYDRTPVIMHEGKVFYPNMKGDYILPPDVTALNLKPTPHNTVLILNGSSGKSDGKHMHQLMIDMNDVVMDDEGNSTTIDNVDIIMVTRVTEDNTKRSFVSGMNTKPLDIAKSDLYDLESAIKPFPHAAIQAIMDGEDYDEVRLEYNLPKFPTKFVDDEDLPF